MMLTRFKIVTAVLLMVSAVGAGGLPAHHTPATEPVQVRQAAAVNDDVQKVLDKYRAARPGAKDLAIFQLDWAPTLKDAKARAAREERPIFLIVVTNSFGNMHSGHC
jgi:hypothetical protein